MLAVDGSAVRNDNHLINMIAMLPVGQRVKLNVWRERQAVALDAVVGDWRRRKLRFRTAASQQP